MCAQPMKMNPIFQNPKDPLQREKANRRKVLLDRAKSLPLSYFQEAGKKMADHFLASDCYAQASVFFAYASMKREADSFYLLERILKDGKRLALPRCLNKGQMEAVEIFHLSDLEIGAYGIMEPKPSCPVVEKKKLDLIYAPCLSANWKGQRLGKGGGFYDRFLADFSGIVLVACPKKLLDPTLPAGPLDQPASLILTEDGLFPAQGE